MVTATLTGRASPGNVLTIEVEGLPDEPAPTVAYSLSRDGVEFATTQTYLVQNSDVGTVISGEAVATITASAPGKMVVAERYIGPHSAGTGDGSSWANQGDVLKTNSFIGALPPGGTIYYAADQGKYSASIENRIIISRGGAEDNHIMMQGVNADLTPAMMEFGGYRTPWTEYPAYVADNEYVTNTWNWLGGAVVFELHDGAKYLTFDHMRFENVGNAWYMNSTTPGTAGDVIHHIHMTNIEGFNVERMLEQAHGELTTKYGYLRVENWNVIGFNEACIRLRASAHDILVYKAYADSGRQDKADFAMCFNVGDFAQNIEFIEVTAKNTMDTGSAYGNGDGFTGERGNKNLYFENCTSTGHNDAGIDTKQDLSTADWLSGETSPYRLRAEHPVEILGGTFIDNKKCLKLWSVMNVQGATIRDAHERFGNAGASLVVSPGDGVPRGDITLTGCTISGNGNLAETMASNGRVSFRDCDINISKPSPYYGKGHLRLIDCTGASVPVITDYTEPKHRGSAFVATSGGSVGPNRPLGKAGDVFFFMLGSDNDGTGMYVSGYPGELWTHETLVTPSSGFFARLAWRRLEGIEYGPIFTGGFVGGAFLHMGTVHLFAGLKATGTPYEGYASAMSSSGQSTTAPAVVVTDAGRMVAHFHIASDNLAVGPAPAGYTQVGTGTTSVEGDGGWVVDVKAGVGAGTAPATSRTGTGAPSVAFSLAMIPV